MAIVDKNANLHGRFGDSTYRNLNGVTVAQSRSSGVEQSVESKKASIEFGLTSNTAACIRNVLEGIFNWYDGQFGNRLTGVLRHAFMCSESAAVNERDFHDSDLSGLAGLEFNRFSPLATMLRVKPLVWLDDSGGLYVKLPALSLKRDIVLPKSSMHTGCSIRVTLFIFNFREEYYQVPEQRETDIKAKGTEETEWYFDPAIPDGCALLPVISLAYYLEDAINGRRNINGPQLNPVALLGAFQFWQGRAGQPVPEPGTSRLLLPGYKGNIMLRNYQIRKL